MGMVEVWCAVVWIADVSNSNYCALLYGPDRRVCKQMLLSANSGVHTIMTHESRAIQE